MGWRDDALSLLDEPDEQQLDEPVSDWRDAARNLISQPDPSPRSFSPAGLSTLKEREGGFYGTPYGDSGTGLAIGYGNQFWKGQRVTPDLRITQPEADEEFQRQIDTDYGKRILDTLKVPVNQQQLDALLSVGYNHFPTAQKIIDKLNAGQQPTPEDFMQSATVKGIPNEGLRTRRQAEYGQFAGAQAVEQPPQQASSWRDEVSAFLQEQEMAPLGPEVDIVKPQVNLGGVYKAPGASPSGATDYERQVIAGSPASQLTQRPSLRTEDMAAYETAQRLAPANRYVDQVASAPPQKPSALPQPSTRLGSAKTGSMAGQPKGMASDVPFGQGLVERPIMGVAQAGRGVAALGAQLAQPPVLPTDPHTMQPSAPGLDSATLNAASDILEGSMQAAEPAAIIAAITNLPVAALGLATAWAASTGAQQAALLAGASPEMQRFLSNIAAAGSMAVSGKQILNVARAGGELAAKGGAEAFSNTTRAAVLAAQLSGRAIGEARPIGAGARFTEAATPTRPGYHAPVSAIDAPGPSSVQLPPGSGAPESLTDVIRTALAPEPPPLNVGVGEPRSAPRVPPVAPAPVPAMPPPAGPMAPPGAGSPLAPAPAPGPVGAVPPDVQPILDDIKTKLGDAGAIPKQETDAGGILGGARPGDEGAREAVGARDTEPISPPGKEGEAVSAPEVEAPVKKTKQQILENIKRRAAEARAAQAPPVEPEKPAAPVTPKASVPFMITRQMETDLRTKGFTDEQIRTMTPAEAHEHLAAAPAVEPEKPSVPVTPKVEAPATVPDSVLSAFVDMRESEGGLLPLSHFTPDEQTALRAAKLVESATTLAGTTYEGVAASRLWPLRKARQEAMAKERAERVAAAEKPSVPVTPEAPVAPEAKPSVPVTPKEAAAETLGARVFKAVQKADPRERFTGNAGVVRARVAESLGVTPQHLAEHINEYEDGLEAVIANKFGSDLTDLGGGGSTANRIALANEAEKSMPRAHQGIAKSELQQFSTPLPIAVAVVDAAGIHYDKDTILEPTAGTGNLLAPLDDTGAVMAIELDPKRVALLKAQDINVEEGDYLRTTIKADDQPTVILTNPPWGKYTTGKYGSAIGAKFTPGDVAERFIAKMMRDLRNGGRLVAVMPTTMLGAKSQEFREWLKKNYDVRAIIQSPPGAYKTRGTDVESLLLVVDKQQGNGTLPAVQHSTSWEEYARAVEGIDERGTVSAAAPAAQKGGQPELVPERPERGPTERGGGGGAETGRDAPVVDREPGELRGTPAEPSGQPPERAGVGGRPESAAGESAGRVPTPAERQQQLVDKLKDNARKRTQQAATTKPPAGDGGELGMAVSTEPSDDDLEVMYDLLQSYLQQGITDFRSAVLKFQKQFGDGARSLDDVLSIAWDELQGEVPGMDAARSVEEALKESARARALKSKDWRPYERRTDLTDVIEHPKLVVEAKQMAGVPYPALTLTMPAHFEKAAKEGWASIEQVEQALAAVQANVEQGHGYLTADNVGVGKSRELALTVNEFMRQAIANKEDLRLLVSTNSGDNIHDLVQNFPYMWTGSTEEGIDLNTGQKTGEAGSVPYEIVNVTDFKDAKKEGDKFIPLPRYKHAIYVIDFHNLRDYHEALQAVELHGIVGDEAHKYKNVTGSKVGKTWRSLHVDIMRRNPRADQRFAYYTATPGTDIEDYEYLYGLRLWPVDGFADWINLVAGRMDESGAKKFQEDTDRGTVGTGEVTGTGVMDVDGTRAPHEGAEGRAARRLSILSPSELEQIPRELKMMGRMSARDLWREGVEFSIHEQSLPANHKATYDAFARLAQDVLDAATKFGKANKRDTGSMMLVKSQLQNAAKRLQLQPAMEEAIEVARAHVKTGHQVVLRVLNVSEVTPEKRGHLAGAINAINTLDVDKGAGGDYIDNGDIPEAVQVRAELLERAAELGKLDAPVAMIEQAFGKERIAYKIGGTTPAEQAAIDEYQQGKRDVLLISAAGATGLNLDHRVLTTPPAGHTGEWHEGRRVFIAVQYAWSAFEELQAIGRVDRASSITPPKVIAITFGNAAEKKFLGTIAGRMASLGGLSRGGAGATGAAAGLEVFEVKGPEMLAAIRDVWQDLDESDRGLFWGGKFKHPTTGKPNTILPDTTSIKDFQLAIIFVPVDLANRIWNKVTVRREEIRAAMGYGATDRTKAMSGEILGQDKLDPLLTIYRVKNQAGHKFGILRGVIMPHMPKIGSFLPLTSTGTPERRYVSFVAGDDIITGLEIPWSRVPQIASLFGKYFAQNWPKTADEVLAAIKVGDRVPLQHKDAKDKRWVLRLRRDDQRITIDGAKMADKELLQRHGANYASVGNYWWLKQEDLGKFLERFPTANPMDVAKDTAAEKEPGTVGMATGRGGPAGRPVLQPPLKPPVPVTGKILSPGKIRELLERGLGVPIRKGMFRSKLRGGLEKLGIYKWKPEVIRTKIANDLPTIAHEVGHHLDKMLQIHLKGPWKWELLKLGRATSMASYTQKQKLMEGAAEFVRLWLSEPATAEQEAEKFFAEFERRLTGSDYEKVMRDAQAAYQTFINLPYHERGKARIDFTGKGPAEDMETRTWLQKRKTEWVDDLDRLRFAVEDMGAPTNVTEHAHSLALMARGAPSIAHGFLEHGVRNPDGTVMGRGLKPILRLVRHDLENFAAFLVARRVLELAGRGIKQGMTTKEARAIIQENQDKEFFVQAAGQLYQFLDHLLLYANRNHALQAKTAIAMKQKGQYYVPLQKVLPRYLFGIGGAKSYVNRRNPLLRRIGNAEWDIINPLESIIKNVYALVDAVEHNKATVALMKQADKTDGSGKWVERIPPQMVPTMFNLDVLEKEIREVMDANGVDLPDSLDLDKQVRVWLQQQFPRGDKGVITFMEAGHRRYAVIHDKALFEALNAIGPKGLGVVMQVLNEAAGVLRAGATLTIGFITRNPGRDTFAAAMQSRYGFIPVYDTTAGLFALLGRTDIYKAYATSGVAQAALVGTDRERLRRDLQKLTGTEAADFRLRMYDRVMSPIEFMRAFSELLETATRLGVYRRALLTERAAGTPPEEAHARATLDSRQATVDFNQGGTYAKNINAVHAFFNAGLQGKVRLAEAAMRDPKKFAIRGFAYITMLSLTMWYLNHDDDEYQEIPNWEKNQYWHFRVPGTDSGFMRIPKPFELGNVFGNSAEAALDFLYKDDPENTVKRLKELLGLEGTNLDILLNLMASMGPTAIMPMLEVMANYDTFTKRHIVSPYMEGLEKVAPELTGGRWTSETAKKLAPWLKMSPAKIDHLIYGYTAGTGRGVVQGLDVGLWAVGATERRPDVTPSRLPLVGTFYRAGLSENATSIVQLYEASVLVTAVTNAMNRYENVGKGETGDKLEAQYSTLMERKTDINAAVRDLREISAEVDEVRADHTLSQAQRDQQVDRLYLDMVNTARVALGKKQLKRTPPAEKPNALDALGR